MDDILKWMVISFIAWPIIVVIWEFLLQPFFQWSVIDVGRKGFVPILHNIASSLIWFAMGILILNLILWYASSVPSESKVLGISIKGISDILPIEFAIPLLISALVINATAHNWSK